VTDPGLNDICCFRGELTLGVHKIPFLEFSPSAPEAAEMARDAGAQVLLLTYYPDKVDPNAIRNAARSVFKERFMSSKMATDFLSRREISGDT
jgi:hypothetical protein